MELFDLDDSFGYLINRTAKRLKFELHAAFSRNGYNITAEQWALLNRLWQEDGLSQIELAEKSYKNKPTITRMLDVLGKRGLVTRKPDEQDRRMFKIYLTGEGRALKDKLVPIAEQVLNKGCNRLTASDLSRLKQILNTIFTNYN